MRLLVTGGAGFIGRSLLRALPPGDDVVVIDSLVPEVHGPAAAFPPDVAARAHCIHCDVGEVEAWQRAAEGVDVVVHLAALTGTGQGMYQQQRYVAGNVAATRRFGDGLAALRGRPSLVILASSRAVYGEGPYRDGDQVRYPGSRSDADLAAGRWDFANAAGEALVPMPAHEEAATQPVSVYALTKQGQEEALAALASRLGFGLLVLRLQNVYGPLQQQANPYTGIVGTFANAMLGEGRLELFEDGEMSRDFVFIDDVVRAMLAGIRHPGRWQHTLNVGTGRRTTLRAMASQLAAIAGVTPAVECTGRYRVGDIRHASADMRAYQNMVGPWRPTPLADGLAAYVAWYGEQPTPPLSNGQALAELARYGILRRARACP